MNDSILLKKRSLKSLERPKFAIDELNIFIIKALADQMVNSNIFKHQEDNWFSGDSHVCRCAAVV